MFSLHLLDIRYYVRNLCLSRVCEHSAVCVSYHVMCFQSVHELCVDM